MEGMGEGVAAEEIGEIGRVPDEEIGGVPNEEKEGGNS